MLWWPLEALVVFAASTTLFDAVHYLLHRWANSRFKLLRIFARWHQVHHEFLDRGMRVHPELIKANFWAHLVPEYLTSLAGTLLFALVFPWPPVLAICAVHTYFFAKHFRDEGVDANHMQMDRVPGKRGVFRVDAAYHAMHHVQPTAFFSSFINIFDMVFGTALKLRGQRVLILGGKGALGRALTVLLMKEGAIVTALGRGEVPPDGWAGNTDILILSSGSRSGDQVGDNFTVPCHLGDLFQAVNAGRLTPVEIWGIGSEAEMFGRDTYARTKRRFADHAAKHWAGTSVVYRHIVFSSFRSKLGWGPMSAKTAAAVAMFLLKRGFMYVPVTLTGVAFLNRVLFGLRKRGKRYGQQLL